MSLVPTFGDDNKEKLLVEAAASGNHEKLSTLLEDGTSVDAEEYNKALFFASENYLTPLQLAAEYGHSKCADILITYGADVNAKNCFDVTALHLAADKGHVQCLRSLLEANADCSPRTKFSKPGYYTAVPYLGGTTPLHLAAKNNHIDCVKELMRNGADYNAVDELGHTCLYIAAKSGNSDCILAILQNAYGRSILSLPSIDTSDTPLHFAVEGCLTECVSKLLKFGSDVNHRNFEGDTPMHICLSIADKKKCLELLKLLVLEGNRVHMNQLNKKKNLTPLGMAYFSESPMCLETVKFLISYGAKCDAKSNWGLSLIQQELRGTSEEILRFVVRNMNQLPLLENLKKNPRFLYRRCLPYPRVRVNEMIENMDKHVWYKTLSTNPRTLQHCCRFAIRKAINPYSMKGINQLPVPSRIKSYIMLEYGD